MNEWDDYWNQGNVSCFPDDPKLDELLTSAWVDIFKLNIKACSILDLACGGGYLTNLLVEEYKNTDKKLQLSLSDICDISIKPTVSNIDLQLFPHTNNELLPFNDNNFDFIISNFGFEYSETQSTIKELCRVLNHKGHFAFNCHYIESQIIKDSINIADALKLWLNTVTIDKIVDQIFVNTSTISSLDKNKQSKLLIDEFVKIDNETNGGLVNSGLLEAILPLLKNNIQQSRINDEYSILKCNYKNYLKRIQAQINAALTDKKIAIIKKQFLLNSIKLDEVKFLNLDGKIISVFIQGSRNIY